MRSEITRGSKAGSSQNEAYCVGCDDDTQFHYVFADEETAIKDCGGSDCFRPVTIGDSRFYVANNGEYDQKRVLVELMYRCLFQPTPFGAQNAHDASLFDKVRLTEGGHFKVPKKSTTDHNLIDLHGMPDAPVLLQVAKTELGYFQDNDQGVKDKELVQLLRDSLPKKKK